MGAEPKDRNLPHNCGLRTTTFVQPLSKRRHVKSSARRAVEEITATATIQEPVLEEFQSLTLTLSSGLSITPDNAIATISVSPTNSTTSPQVKPQSPQGAQSLTQDEAIASISASPTNSATSPQRAQSVAFDKAIAFISTSPTNRATSTPQVISEGTEYTAILELSSTPSGPLTWEHRMKEWGSTAYEGLKMAIQGIYDFSGSFPPLHTTAGALLTICKVVDVRGSVLYV